MSGAGLSFGDLIGAIVRGLGQGNGSLFGAAGGALDSVAQARAYPQLLSATNPQSPQSVNITPGIGGQSFGGATPGVQFGSGANQPQAPNPLGMQPGMNAALRTLPPSMGMPLLMSSLNANMPTPQNRLTNAQATGANLSNASQIALTNAYRQAHPELGLPPINPSDFAAGLPNQTPSVAPTPSLPMQQAAPDTSQSALDEAKAQTFIKQTIPNAVITSGARTMQQNAAAGGVSDSMHLSGQAVDFVPNGRQWTQDDLHSFAKILDSQGLPHSQLMIETADSPHSTGYHVHWGWAGAQQTDQSQPVQQAAPRFDAGVAAAYGDPSLLMKQQQIMTPTQVKAAGYRDGTIVSYNPITNEQKVEQEPDVKSPGAQAQAIELSKAEAMARNQAAVDAINQVAPGFIDQQAKAIAEYRVQPQQVLNRNPAVGASVMAKVYQINPSYDARQFQGANRAVTAFDTGKQGDTVRSMNVAIQHLGTLQQVAGALQNGDVKALNMLNNTFQDQFGSPVPNNFDAVRNIVSDEVTKAVLGGAGALGDRDAIRATISRANSPAQLAGVVQNYKSLLAGQLNGLRQQFVSSAHLPASSFDEKLLPQTRVELASLGNQRSQAQAAAPSFVNGQVYVDKNGNRAQYQNGKWIPK